MVAYQAVDARTRAERPFWHHTGSSGVVFRPIGVSTGASYDASDEKVMAQVRESNRTFSLQRIDFVCGLLSLVALVLTIPGLVRDWNIDNDLRWPMWQETVLCYNASFNASQLQRVGVDITSSANVAHVFETATAAGMQFAFNTTDSMTQQYCSDKEEYALPHLGRTWDGTRYQCSVLQQKVQGFDLWLALRLVFLISIVFQWGRAYMSNTDTWSYDPFKPDFWRWWEYALTSSVQTAIIALSFFIGNRDEVLCLAALQAAMCLLGFAIEKRIDKLYKAKTKNKKEDAGSWKTQFKVAKLLILFTAAWAFFTVIWYILLTRFDRQRASSQHCDYDSTMPDAVYFIVYGEFALFISFGIAQTAHVLVALYQTSSSDTESVKSHRIKTWYYMAVVYSVLSVVAKTILEVGLLWLSKEAANMI